MATDSHQRVPPRRGVSVVSPIGLVADVQRPASAHQPSGESDEPQTPRVAILDCDSGFLAVLTNRIERLGWQYRVLSARTTQKTLASLQADVLIVDLSMLGARRWKWLARQCEQRPDVRVIVCSGTSTVAERVCALRLGADDWLAKPCHPEELIARVEAVTSQRHRPEPRDLSPVIVGEVEIRPDLYQAFVHGHSLGLTRREYQLIQLLSRAGSEIQPREVIYECLWGYTMARNDRSVDVFIHKLRRKLERASPEWRYIHTHFGIGYRLGAERVDGAAELELGRAREPLVARLAA
jgi:DNA-binding response OmpR family regulator